jgi:hypothetical protein
MFARTYSIARAIVVASMLFAIAWGSDPAKAPGATPSTASAPGGKGWIIFRGGQNLMLEYRLSLDPKGDIPEEIEYFIDCPQWP